RGLGTVQLSLSCGELDLAPVEHHRPRRDAFRPALDRVPTQPLAREHLGLPRRDHHRARLDRREPVEALLLDGERPLRALFPRAQLVLARCERALALLDLRQPLHRRRQLCLAPRERGDALVDRVLARDELGLAHLETLQALEPDPKLRLAALELHLRLTDRAFALLQLRELREAALHLGLRALQLGLRLRERALLLCDRRLALGELRRRLDARRLALPDLLDAELECVLALGEARLRVAQPGVLLGDA